jgi:heme exporter protein D
MSKDTTSATAANDDEPVRSICTVWVTRHATTSGIHKHAAYKVSEEFVYVKQPNRDFDQDLDLFQLGTEAFFTYEAAKASAGAKVLLALKSLERRKAKLEDIARRYGVEP